MNLSEHNKKRLGNYLRDIREDAKKIQTDIAKPLKLKSNQHISNVERGISSCSTALLKTYRKVCNVNKSDFITEVQKIYIDEIREVLR